MKYKALIFLDIDGTLLAPNYKPNSDMLSPYIRRLSQKGYLFGLNSNRSLQDLKPLIKQFSIKGPVIGENGVFMFKGGKISMLKNVRPIRKKLENILSELAANFGAQIKYGDTVSYDWKNLEKVPLAWIVNKYRKWTGSIHVRKYGKPAYLEAKNLAKKLTTSLKLDYQINVSRIFSNVLIIPKGINKGEAIKIICHRYSLEGKLIMIGDDSADLSTRKVVDEFYAVANADKKLKLKSRYIAKEKYTKGVIDILRYIENQHSSDG